MVMMAMAVTAMDTTRYCSYSGRWIECRWMSFVLFLSVASAGDE